MLFYLNTLILVRFLKEDAPIAREGEAIQVINAINAWNNYDFLA